MTNEVVAVFGAHPDDLDWACGGTTAAGARGGKKIYFLVSDSGGNGEGHQRGVLGPPATCRSLTRACQPTRCVRSILAARHIPMCISILPPPLTSKSKPCSVTAVS